MCVVISAGRGDRLSSVVIIIIIIGRKQRNCLHICLHLHEVKRCRAIPFPRASIRLFFWGRCGDPQAAVRNSCIHIHFANVLLRRQTARIRQGGQDLQADQVVDQFVRTGGSSGADDAKHNGQVWHRHATLLRGLAMHATAFSPVLIGTVLEGIKKQMCSDGQLAAVDLKLGEPIPSEPVFDIADEQTGEMVRSFRRDHREHRFQRTWSRRASPKKSFGRKRSISITGHPEPMRRRDEHPSVLVRFV